MSTKTSQSEMQKVPKLRFAGFDGVWEEKKLGDVTTFLKGKGISKDDISEDGKNKCIRYGELYTTYSEIINEVKSKTNVSSDESLLSMRNDILIPSSGETALDIATVSCVKEDGVILGGDLNVIRLQENQDGNFFAYYLSNFQDKQIAELAQGNSVVHLYSSSLKDLKISNPSLSEQQKIAGFLGGVDEWIENLKKEKENFELYKKRMMQKLFGQEIRFKDSNGKEFPKWEEKKLEGVAEIIGGGTPDTTIQKYWNGEINWFTPTEIKFKYAKSSLRKISDTGLKDSSAKLLPVGTLLFTSRATVGDISISTIECSTNQGFQSFVVNKENSNEFLYYWILQNKKEFLKRANGSTFPEVSGKEIKKMKGVFPSLLEQQKIADFLTSVDKVIESKQQQITQAEQWKDGLMQGLFV